MSFIINDKVQFNHIPKTGGTFAKQLFRRYVTKDGIKHKVNDFEGNFYNVCIIKEPISWWESYWNWKGHMWVKADGNDSMHEHPTKPLYDCRARTIEEFVENVYNEHPMFLTNMYREFCRECHYVYVFEELKIALRQIGMLAGINLSLNYINNYPIVNRKKINDRIQSDSIKDLIIKNEFLLYETVYSDVRQSKVEEYAVDCLVS